MRALPHSAKGRVVEIAVVGDVAEDADACVLSIVVCAMRMNFT